jgi:hypothetical protein
MDKRNINARSHKHCCRERAASIIYYECVSIALVMQQAMRMRRTVLSSVARLALPQILFTLSHKRHDFRKKNFIEYKLCVLIFSTRTV